MNNFPNESRDLIFVQTLISQICRTFVSMWDLCIRDGMTIVQVILLHEYGWFQCYRHEHSPYHGMFLLVFCNIFHRRSFLSFPHLIIHPTQEWSRFHWDFWFCFIVSNDKLLWPYFSLGDHNGLPRSIMKFFLIRNGLPRSIVLGLLMKETWLGLVCLSPRSHNGLPPFHHPSICQLSTLEKTKLCYHATLSSVLRKSFQ